MIFSEAGSLSAIWAYLPPLSCRLAVELMDSSSAAGRPAEKMAVRARLAQVERIVINCNSAGFGLAPRRSWRAPNRSHAGGR
jgi:hypothetical protein